MFCYGCEAILRLTQSCWGKVRPGRSLTFIFQPRKARYTSGLEMSYFGALFRRNEEPGLLRATVVRVHGHALPRAICEGAWITVTWESAQRSRCKVLCRIGGQSPAYCKSPSCEKMDSNSKAQQKEGRKAQRWPLQGGGDSPGRQVAIGTLCHFTETKLVLKLC